jgi:hypothetical protein
MRRIVLLLVLLAFAVACRSMPVAGECPESVSMKCLAGKKCSEDTKRGCIVCRCDAPNVPSETSAQEEMERGRSPDFPR